MIQPITRVTACESTGEGDRRDPQVHLGTTGGITRVVDGRGWGRGFRGAASFDAPEPFAAAVTVLLSGGVAAALGAAMEVAFGAAAAVPIAAGVRFCSTVPQDDRSRNGDDGSSTRAGLHLMPTVIAISGSLRAKSFNTMLLHAAAAATPTGTTIEVGSIKDIPLYDGDVEATSGVPAAVSALKERIVAADGLLLVSPEYNNGIPGVFKNVVDWLSRPPTDIPRVFGERAVGVIGATPGRGGTALAQAGWLPVLRTLGAQLFTGARLQVSNAGKVFDADGALTDDAVRAQVEKYMAGFARFVAKHVGAR